MEWFSVLSETSLTHPHKESVIKMFIVYGESFGNELRMSHLQQAYCWSTTEKKKQVSKVEVRTLIKLPTKNQVSKNLSAI